MDKKSKKRLAVKRLATERNISLSVAAHIYACWSNKQKKAAREAAVGGCTDYKTKQVNK